MVIVSGYLVVDPDQRATYLTDCKTVVEQARTTNGCLEFSLSADLIDPARIMVYERWDSRESVESFRGSGPSDEQSAAILDASVSEYKVITHRAAT